MGFLSDREELVDVVHAASRTNVPVEHPVHVDVVKQGHGNRTSESGQSVFTGGMVNPDGLQTPVGGWLIIGDYTIHILVQCGAPQWCLLVYKPHEYYSYIYHKPQWNWSYVNPNLAFTNWGTTLWLSQSMNGEFRYQMTKAAVPIATYPSTVCGSAWLGLLGYESKLSPRIRWLTHLNTRNIIKYLRKKTKFCGPLSFLWISRCPRFGSFQIPFPTLQAWCSNAAPGCGVGRIWEAWLFFMPLFHRIYEIQQNTSYIYIYIIYMCY